MELPTWNWINCNWNNWFFLYRNGNLLHKAHLENRNEVTHMLSFLPLILVIEQHFDSFNEFLGNGMQKCVFSVNIIINKQFDHIQVFIVNSHQKRWSAQRVHTVYVDVVVLFIHFLQYSAKTNAIKYNYFNLKLFQNELEKWKTLKIDI